jgi:hypothetical protein
MQLSIQTPRLVTKYMTICSEGSVLIVTVIYFTRINISPQIMFPVLFMFYTAHSLLIDFVFKHLASKPMGPHGLLQGELYFYYLFLDYNAVAT